MATKLTQQISSSIPIRNTGLELFSYEQVPLTEETRATHIRLIYPCTAPSESSSKFSWSFELKAVPVDSCPKYEALSYTWGQSLPDFPITLNGHKFYITPSLGTALFYACRGRKAPIWIDQICINQQSNEEKNAQLPLMSKIYSDAAEVRIWLGEAADGSDELIDALASAGRKCRDCGIETLLTRENFLRFNSWTGGVDQNDLPRRRPFLDLCQEIIPPLSIDAFKAWFSRPWFHRVWTIQEFALAATSSFVCGNKSVAVDDVKYVWIVYGLSPPTMRVAGPSPLAEKQLSSIPTPENLARNADLITLQNEWHARLMSLHELVFMDPLTPLTKIRKRRQMFDDGSGPGISLFELLVSLVKSRRQCAVPKDWIYGLLGLSNDLTELGIVPDYGLSTETVYSQFTRKTIENGNLEILRYSIYPKSYQSNYPSWVPDWASRPQPSTFDYADDLQIRDKPGEPGLLFNASGATKMSVTNVGDEKLLALQCFVVDEIEELGSPWLGGITQSEKSPERMETLSFLSSVRLLCLLSATKNHPIYPKPERRQEAIWRIPIADLVRVTESTGWQYNARATQAAEQGFRHVMAFEEGHQERGFLSQEARDELSKMVSREKENGAQQYRDAMTNLKRKRPYITKLGYVGLGPVFAKPGDKVVVFMGAAIPFVIRPVKGGYCLLGESYCDGIMDGEIVSQRKEETIVLT